MRISARFAAFAVLLTIGSLMTGTATAEPLKNNASTNTRLKYLPNDYYAIIDIDMGMLGQFMKAADAQGNPSMAQLKEFIELVKLQTGINLEKDVDGITIFVTGSLEAPKMLAVIEGSFKNDFVRKQLKKGFNGSITEKMYKKQPVYTIEPFDVSFPEDSTILVGDAGLVRRAMDQGASDKADPLPPSLKGVLERTPGNAVVWTAFRPQVFLSHAELAGWRESNPELHKELKKIDVMSVFFDLSDDGLLIKGIGHVNGPDAAASLHKYLSDRKKNLLHEEGTNVVFTSLLILSQVKVNGSYVEGSFRMTAEAFQELWDTKLIVRPEQGLKKPLPKPQPEEK